MNFSNSTTGKTERLTDKNVLATQWEPIDWTQLQKDVNKLQTRIAKATVTGSEMLEPYEWETLMYGS